MQTIHAGAEVNISLANIGFLPSEIVNQLAKS